MIRCSDARAATDPRLATDARSPESAGREGLRDGTTAIVALVQADTLTVAHVGDSRGVLCRKNGSALALTQDHKPELEAEKARIEGPLTTDSLVEASRRSAVARQT